MSGSALKPGMHNRILGAILNNDVDDNTYGKGMWEEDRKRKSLYILTASTIFILEYMG